MQLGTALKEGLQVLILGLGITLLALSLLILIVELINKLVNAGKNSKPGIDKEVSNNVDDSVDLIIDDNGHGTKDEELVAVISAAIAAMLDGGAQPFKIKKIRHIPASTPKWNQAGRRDQLLNRR